MFILPTVHDSILDAGIQFIDRGDSTVDLLLAADPAPVRVRVKSWDRAVGPSVVARLAADHSQTQFLLVAPSFSPGVRHAIEGLGWSWISVPADGPVSGRITLTGPKLVEIGNATASHPSLPAPGRGRRQWQRHAITRHLLLGDEWTQAELVEVCEVTQPRVSQVLKELANDGLVSRTRPLGAGGPLSWVALDRAHQVDSWLNTYPGPGGASPTYWLGLDTIREQAQAAWTYIDRTLGSEEASHGAIVSGDAAADFIAPYRRSHLAVIYSSRGVDLTDAGFTPSPRQHATLQLIVPTDPSVWPHPYDDPSLKLAPNAPFPIADPLQVAWDLLRSSTPDADQAARAVVHALLNMRSRIR